MKRTFPINLNRYLIALLEGSGGGGGFTPPAGAEGDLLTFHSGAWETVIAPGATAGFVLTSTGAGSLPTYQAIQKTPLGPLAFVDPANSTGFASDNNTGANSTNSPPGTGPILTTAHAKVLLFDKYLLADRTIQYLSDDTSNVGLDFSTLDLNSFELTVNGTLQTVHTGGTINAGTTAINPATNQRQLVHTSDLATFNPYVFTLFGGTAANPTLFTDTVTGSRTWVVTDATAASPTPATASVTQPINDNGTIGAFTIGHAYTLSRGSIITLSGMEGPVGTGGVSYNNFAFTANSIGNPAANYTNCSFLNTVSVLGQFQNCALMLGATQGSTIISGLYIPNGDTGESVGTILIGGNAYVAQPTVDNTFTIGGSFIGSLFVFEQFGANTGGIQIQDSITNGLEIYQGGVLQADVLIWGNGNAGVGILVHPAAAVAVGSKTNGTSPTVTGTAGDFAFVAVDSPTNITVARAWNNAVGAYTEAGGVATRTTTWAHFVATIGAGGFDFHAQCLESSSALVGARG